jgi:hypothetical protein
MSQWEEIKGKDYVKIDDFFKRYPPVCIYYFLYYIKGELA